MLIVRTKANAMLFALCLCLASICHAIGFGDLKVYSYLNEPLVAEITLTNFKDMDSGLLKASLADAKDFVRAGIDRPYFLTYLIFEVISYEEQLLIVVRTSKPIQSPYLEFLVELSWPEGNLVKDYTILLDPPPPNLTTENRPKSISQIASQSLSKNFGQNAIQQQLDKQKADKQRNAAVEDLSDVVKLAPNSFSDNTFEVPTPEKDTQLVPSEVPDIDETEQAELKAKAEQEAAQVARAATEAAYQKQLAKFKQQEQQKTSITSKQKNTTILNKVVDQLESFDSHGSQPTPATKPIAKMPTQEAPPYVTPAETHNAEPIDFQHVIPPVAPTAAVPVVPAAPAVYQPPSDIKSEASTSNHLYLGIILSLLLVAAGIAIAVKRMRDIKQHAPKSEDFSMPEEGINRVQPEEPEFEEPEEIELASATDTVVNTAAAIVAASDDSSNKFDIEFANIDLGEPTTPIVPDPEPIIIEPPTLVKTSELTLEPEGATLINQATSIVDNSEAIQVKLELVKQYLETGDKESAKELLQGIIDIANDTQRLEAQMLLSGIV